MKKNILFVHYGDNWIRGSEKCLLDLIKYMTSQRYQAYVWTNNHPLSKQLEIMGIENELNQFPLLLGWKSPKYNISSWFKLIEYGCHLIERENIDLIHVNSGAPCQWMLAAARIKKIPLVTQLHCPYSARDRLTLGLHLSPHIISVSRYAAKMLVEDGYPQSKISVIHNGIDIKALLAQPKVDIRRQLNIADHDFLFATVGSLIQRKGVDRIMTAMRHVTLEYPNVSLIVIGDGPIKTKLQQQAEYLHLQDRIYFVGEQSNVVGWLKACDAFISGARSEAFGLAIAEAGLAKIPIIAPFEGGIPEFITHGDTGVLYPNHGIAPIAKAMRIVVNNPLLCNKLGLNAFEYISQHHDITTNCCRIEQIYQKILRQPETTRRSFFNTFSPIKTYVAQRLGDQHVEI